MPPQPYPLRLNPALTILSSSPESYAVLSENKCLLLNDPAVTHIIGRLQHPTTLDHLIASAPFAREVIVETVEELYNAGLITVNTYFARRNLAAFWDTLFLTGPTRRLFVEASAPEFAQSIENLLAANHVDSPPRRSAASSLSAIT